MESSIKLRTDIWCNLGIDCVEKIFARLPTKDLVRARCLSKFWEKTIISSWFVKEIISVSGPKCAYTTFRNTFHSRSLDFWEGYDWLVGEWRLLFLFEPCREYLDFLNTKGPKRSRPHLVSTSGNLFCFYTGNCIVRTAVLDEMIAVITYCDIFVLDPVRNTFRTLPTLSWQSEYKLDAPQMQARISVVDADHYIVTVIGRKEDRIIYMFSSRMESWVTHKRSDFHQIYLGVRIYEKKLYFVSMLSAEPYFANGQLLLESYHVEDKRWENPVISAYHFEGRGLRNCKYGIKVLMFSTHRGLMLARPFGRHMWILHVHEDGSMHEIARSKPKKNRCKCWDRQATGFCGLHYFFCKDHIYVVFSCVKGVTYEHALCYSFVNEAWTEVLHNLYIRRNGRILLNPELTSIADTPFVYGVSNHTP